MIKLRSKYYWSYTDRREASRGLFATAELLVKRSWWEDNEQLLKVNKCSESRCFLVALTVSSRLIAVSDKITSKLVTGADPGFTKWGSKWYQVWSEAPSAQISRSRRRREASCPRAVRTRRHTTRGGELKGVSSSPAYYGVWGKHCKLPQRGRAPAVNGFWCISSLK